MENNTLWQIKLAARVHDPAEKALVLMRDPAGHEGGTTRALLKNFFPDGLDDKTKKRIKQADHWASAADRPQFPQDANNRFAKWTQVKFLEKPEIKHPLTGKSAELDSLTIDPEHIKAFSTDSFKALIEKKPDGSIDWCKTLLGFWRFGPELNPEGLGYLWRLLPADTRIPDHTIWAHLDLTSAFCGAFAADDNDLPALLNISFGPVQSFIAAGRSTSDLWAGSHLLSRIVWEGIKVICERLGPDAIIFPQVRGVPMVDLWLQKEMGLSAELFKDCDWRKAKTDGNPLFSAALPNKFVALVPASLAKELAEEVIMRVRAWVMGEAEVMLKRCLTEAKVDDDPGLHCYRQLKEQLDGFPEVHWAAVPWLCQQKNGSVNTDELADAMRPFYPESNMTSFLNSELWQLLNKAIEPEQNWKFYNPNPGVLYPAVFDLLDRVAAAAKSTRTFKQMPQQGYRNTLSGDYEWLTTDPEQLQLPPGKRQDTLWLKVAERKPSWVKKGEHLSALDMLKRLWPTRFIDEIKNTVEGLEGLSRYVVSTHDMAFATGFEQWLKQGKIDELPMALRAQLENWDTQSALPKKLLKQAGDDQAIRTLAKKLPSFYEATVKDGIENRIIPEFAGTLNRFFQETYYGLILLDGDNMGAWLAGSEDKYRLPYRNSWHSQVQAGIDRRYADQLQPYLDSLRHASPARHMAISEALNGFSLDLVRFIVEELYKGKVIYSGGDDVMAMVAVDDLLPVMLLLRLVYSGQFPVNGAPDKIWDMLLKQAGRPLEIGNGYVRKQYTLYRVMGERATASCGAVIAHHTAPLGQVLKSVRAAEQRAKKTGGRNAFAIDVLKRSGGDINLTSPWFNYPEQPESLLDSPMGQLIRLRDALAEPNMSRRAAYIAQDWLRQLPPKALFDNDPALYRALLEKSLAYPLVRQNRGTEKYHDLAESLVGIGMTIKGQAATDFIAQFIGVAEFLARDCRSGDSQ